ncbi:hypothetical protein K438DRAFT_1967239 [Mycena galopus ATCC 62051]|nr:hypothetical protein K438DRAFT_1967239 [Mycena galopus ATCC 62051]
MHNPIERETYKQQLTSNETTLEVLKSHKPQLYSSPDFASVIVQLSARHAGAHPPLHHEAAVVDMRRKVDAARTLFEEADVRVEREKRRYLLLGLESAAAGHEDLQRGKTEIQLTFSEAGTFVLVSVSPPKHPKLRRALKLPYTSTFHRRAGTTTSGRNTFAPRASEQPIVYLPSSSPPSSSRDTELPSPVAKKTLNHYLRVGTFRSHIAPSLSEFEDNGELSSASSSSSEGEEGEGDSGEEGGDSDEECEGEEPVAVDLGADLDADADDHEQYLQPRTPTTCLHLHPPDINTSPGSQTPTASTGCADDAGAAVLWCCCSYRYWHSDLRRPEMGKKRPSFIALPLPRKSLKSRSRSTTPREASAGSTGSGSGDRQGRKGRGEEKKAPPQQQQGDAGKQRKQAGRGCRKP